MCRAALSLALCLFLPSIVGAQPESNPASVPPEVPSSDTGLSPNETLAPSEGKVTDSLERIERRLDNIETRLDSSTVPETAAGTVEETDRVAVPDNQWRFRYHRGTWWYWLPSSRWVYWRNGTWIDFDPATYVPPVVVRRSYRPYYAYPSYSGYYNYGGPSTGFGWGHHHHSHHGHHSHHHGGHHGGHHHGGHHHGH